MTKPSAATRDGAGKTLVIMPVGEFLIRVTAMAAVSGYAGRVLIDAGRGRAAPWQRIGRILWTIGGSALLVHTMCAFHFRHHWNYASAWEHTREETLRMTGWNSGDGVVVNLAFLAIWLLDAAAWMRSLNWPRHRVWYWTVQAAFGFLMFQATAVFGPWYWRPTAGVFVGLVLCMMWRRPFAGD